MRKRNVFDIILDIIIVLLIILVIYWFIQLILGGSPGLSEFNSAFIVLITSFVIKIYREIGVMKIEVRHSFNNIKKDFDLIKNKLKI